MTNASPIPSLEQVENNLYKPDNYRKLRSIIDLNLDTVNNKGEYLHWDQFKKLKPPKGLTVAEHWFGLKKARESTSLPTGLEDSNNQKIIFCIINKIQENLFFIDRYFKGNADIDQILMNTNTRNTYRVKYRIEESIYSAYLDGYAVEKSTAENIIKGIYKAENKNEQMFVNAYQLMQEIDHKKDQKLTTDLIFSWHSLLTKNDTSQDKILNQLQPLCDFINSDQDQDQFIHPMIKALILHYYVLETKPFTKANGIIARILCHWYLIKHGYWLLDFTSISKALKTIQTKYTKSIKYSQSDHGDLTYFLVPMVQTIRKSLEGIQKDLDQSVKDISEVEDLMYKSGRNIILNHRQLLVLTHAINNPNYTYTIQEYMKTYDSSYQTARTDLLMLSDELNYLQRRKYGKTFAFISPENLDLRLQKKGKTQKKAKK